MTDLVIALDFTTYADSVRRKIFSPDVLVEFTIGSPDIERLLVADPWRSYAARLKRLATRESIPFPRQPGRHHIGPLRMRREDPLDYQRIRGESRRYLARVRREAARRGLQNPALIATHPFVAAAADPAAWRTVSYYGWDDWCAHPAMRQWWPAFEAAYVDIARNGVRVVGVTERIVERIGSPVPCLVLPNGLRAEEWQTPVAPPQWFADLPAPRLLYTGALDARLDISIVRAIAKAYPHGTVLLAGAVLRPQLADELADLPQVRLLGLQPRDVVQALTFNCDVALMPHVRNELTLAMSPLKLFEYLAAGRPVVATDLPAVRGLTGVALADGVDEFVAAVGDALLRRPTDETSRLAFVAANSWTQRLNELIRFATAEQ